MERQSFFEIRQQELADLIQKVDDGKISPLIAYAQVKIMENIYTDAKKQITDQALDEAEKYPGKVFSEGEFIFEKRNGSARYSYKNIPQWQEINKMLKECEATHKAAFLAKQKNILVADENGEEFTDPVLTYTKDMLILKNS